MSNGPTGPARQLSRSELQRRQSSAIRRTGLTVGGERIFRGPGGRLQTESEARASQRSALGGPSGRVLVVDGETVQTTAEKIVPLAAATREAGQPLRAERTAEGGFAFSVPQSQAFQQRSVRALNLGDPSVARAVRELAEQGLSPQQIFDFAERNVPLDTVASGFARASIVDPVSGERFAAVVDREGRVVQRLSSEGVPVGSLPVVSPLERGRAFGLFDADSVDRQPFFFSRVTDRLRDAPMGSGVVAPFARLGRGVAAGVASVGSVAERGVAALTISRDPFFDVPGLQSRRQRFQEELSSVLPFVRSDPRDTLSGVGPALRTFEPDPFIIGAVIGEGLATAPIAAPRASLRLASGALRASRVPLRLAAQPFVDLSLAGRAAGRGVVRLLPDASPGGVRVVSVGADPVSGRPFASGDLPSTIDFGVVAPRRRVVERTAIDSRFGERVDLGLTSQELAELQARPGGEQQLLLAPPRSQAGRGLVTESGAVVGFSRDPVVRVDELIGFQQRQADELAAAIGSRRDFDRLIGSGSAPEQRGLFPVQVIDSGSVRRLDSDVVLFGDTAGFQRDLLDFDVALRPDRVSSFPVGRFVAQRPVVPRSFLFSDEPFVDLSGFSRPLRSSFDIPAVRGRRAQFAPTVQVPRVTSVPRSRSPLRFVDDLVDSRASVVSSVTGERLSFPSRLGFLSGGRGLLGQVNNLASGSVSALDTSLLGALDSRLLFDSAVSSDSRLLFDSDVRLDSRSLTRSRSILDSRSVLDFDVASDQVSRPRAVAIPRPRGRGFGARPVIRPRVPVDVDVPSFSSADAALGDFRVVVGRPGNVVYQDLGVGGRELIEQGRDIVRNTAAASVTVVPTNPRAAKKNVIAKLGKGFKRGSRKDSFVEKRSERISSPGELADITRKGLSAVRRAGSVTRASDAARELVDLGIPLRTVRRKARAGGLLDDFF